MLRAFALADSNEAGRHVRYLHAAARKADVLTALVLDEGLDVQVLVRDEAHLIVSKVGTTVSMTEPTRRLPFSERSMRAIIQHDPAVVDAT